MEVTSLAELPAQLVALRQRVAELENTLACRNAAPSVEALDRQWRMVNTALSHSPDSPYIFALDGRLIYANRTLLNLWGKPLHDVVGRTFHPLGYPAGVGGATRMERLVQDLLAYTRAASHRLISPELVDTEKILKGVLADMQSTIERAEALIHFTELPPVFVDKVHLGQLFQNLIANAIKYRSEDVPPIRISAAKCGEMSRFSVEDNGIGIEPEYAEQVFGLFKRLHTNDQYEGTGIGLAICHKIVTRYGGRIWLESKPGCCSSFFFTAPA